MKVSYNRAKNLRYRECFFSLVTFLLFYIASKACLSYTLSPYIAFLCLNSYYTTYLFLIAPRKK